MKTCNKCNIELVSNENWLISYKNRYIYICKSCDKKLRDLRGTAKEISKRWQEKHPNQSSEWRKNNPEKAKQIDRKWRANNPDKKKEYNKKYYDPEYSKKWRKNNVDKMNQSKKLWRLNNPAKIKENRIKRNKLLKGAITPTSNIDKMNQLYQLAKDLETLTGYKWHVDHIIPLSKGGKHHQDNMCVITAKDNMEKKDNIIAWRIDYYGDDNILEI